MAFFRSCANMSRMATHASSVQQQLITRSSTTTTIYARLLLPGSQLQVQQQNLLSTSGKLNGKMLYSERHEYLNITDNKARLGITDHAQKELGDVVFVELPDLDFIAADAVACTVESVKAVAEVYMPVDGNVTAVNGQLQEQPELVNSSYDTDGWLIEFEVTKPEQLDTLMDEAAYEKYLQATD